MNKSNENRCLFCGEIIPEGRQVCPICERKLKEKAEQFREALKLMDIDEEEEPEDDL